MPVVSISGDGGFMFTANEMATAMRHRIPLTAIVFDDGAFGNVRRIQEERFGNRLIASDLANPDFVQFAESFGAAGERARTPEELRARVAARRSRAATGRRLIEVPVGPFPSPWPVLPHHAAQSRRDVTKSRCLIRSPGIELTRAIFKSAYAQPVTWNSITTTEELGRRPASGWRAHPFVTIDTEFLRETTYYPLLCVAQMASPDEAVVIDALAPGHRPHAVLRADGERARAQGVPRRPPGHRNRLAPREAASRIRSSTPRSPPWCWATANSISYDQLVQRITGDTLDKSNRFTDWTRRPLSPAQVTYAVSDVTHLRDVYLALVADLEPRGRTDWMDDEMEILTSPDTYRAEPETRLDAAQDPGAQAQGARRADRGRGLARARGADPRRAALARAQGRHHRRHRHAGADHARAARPRCARCPKGFERSKWGEGILDAVKRGLARDPKTLPRIERPKRRRTAAPPSNCSRCCCA